MQEVNKPLHISISCLLKYIYIYKGLSFCPTPRDIDLFALRKDISDYVRRLRLKEYFLSNDYVGGVTKNCWNSLRILITFMTPLSSLLIGHEIALTI